MILESMTHNRIYRKGGANDASLPVRASGDLNKPEIDKAIYQRARARRVDMKLPKEPLPP